MKLFSMFLILLLALAGMVFAAHPPKTTITEYTYVSKLNPNEFIKWDILESKTKNMGYSYRIVQKDNQVILLRFHFGALSGYAYYLDDQLYIYTNGHSVSTHFVEDIITSAKKRAVDSWLDRHRKVKVSFINNGYPYAVLGLVKFVIKDGAPIDYIILNERWNENSKILSLELGIYGLTKYDPVNDKIIDYKQFEVKDKGMIIKI